LSRPFGRAFVRQTPFMKSRNNTAVRLRLVILCLLAFVSLASAQDVNEYVRMRKQLGVKQPVTAQALNELTGSHAVEVKGTVKGTFKMGSKVSLLVNLPDDSSITVEADTVPDWLASTDVPARLLVRASREDQYASLKAILINAAPENLVAKFDPKPVAKPKTGSEVTIDAKGGGSPLSGPIGRGGSFSRRQPKLKPKKTWNLPMSKATPFYASFIKKQNSKLSNNDAYRIAQAIIGFSLHYGIDPRLTMAIVMVESGFDPSSTSSAGAMGLGQLMPDTAKWMGVSNAYDTYDNLAGSVKLMRYHLMSYKTQTGDNFKSLVLALAAYNAGEGAVRRANGIPYNSVSRYVQRVIGLYRQFCGV